MGQKIDSLAHALTKQQQQQQKCPTRWYTKIKDQNQTNKPKLNRWIKINWQIQHSTASLRMLLYIYHV